MTDDAKNRGCFVVNRGDGLGTRLLALINAMALAEHFGTDFRFTWRLRTGRAAEHHVIENVDSIFSHEFIARHYLEVAPEPNTMPELRNGWSEAALAIHLENASVEVNQQDPHNMIRSLQNKIGPESFRKAFRNIGFSAEARKAIELADDVPISPMTTAVHLRAGDIIYSHIASIQADRWAAKALPFPLAAELIASEQKKGTEVILFGEDRPLVESLCEAFGVTSTVKLIEQFKLSELQATLFELVVMSKCTVIYSGHSTFPQLALRIGGGKHANPNSLFTPEEVVKIVIGMRGADKVSSLQRAFAYWYAAHFYRQAMTESEFDHCLERAIELDPENRYYRMVQAAWQCSKGDYTGAEEGIAGSVRDRRVRKVLERFFLIRERYPYFEWIRKSADQGSPFACLCIAYASWVGGDIDTAKRYAKHARAAASSRTVDRGMQNIVLHECAD